MIKGERIVVKEGSKRLATVCKVMRMFVGGGHIEGEVEDGRGRKR
jgi:hypothetical protein